MYLQLFSRKIFQLASRPLCYWIQLYFRPLLYLQKIWKVNQRKWAYNIINLMSCLILPQFFGIFICGCLLL